MSLRTLEAEILREARVVTKKKTLRQKDIMEWTTGTIEPRSDESIFRLPEMGVNIAVLKSVLG